MSRLTPESIRASQAELPPIGTVITELRRQDPYIQQEQHRYRSPRGFQHWANHLAYAALIEAGLQVMDEMNDPIGFWAATTCRWARIVEAPPRFLAPELAEAFRRTPSPHLDEELPQVLPCFRLMLPDGALFTEDGVPIPYWRGDQGFQDTGAHVRQEGQRRTSALARSEPEATRAGCWSEKPQARA